MSQTRCSRNRPTGSASTRRRLYTPIHGQARHWAYAARHADTHGDVYDTPDASLAVLLEHGSYLVAVRQVACEGVDLGAVLVLLGRICGQGTARQLGDAVERPRVCVVEVVDGDDFVATCGLQGVDDV